jgi:hypothetical protein
VAVLAASRKSASINASAKAAGVNYRTVERISTAPPACGTARGCLLTLGGLAVHVLSRRALDALLDQIDHQPAIRPRGSELSWIAEAPAPVNPGGPHIWSRQNLDVVPVPIPSRQPLDAARDVCPITAGNVNVGAVWFLAEDKCSPWGVHVCVYLTLSKERLVHGFGRTVPAVLSLRHAESPGYESFASVWAELV